MTSEVENILNGQVVRKINADKAIGVNAKNLSPNEKGEIPLSNQSAFEIESLNIPADKVQENLETFDADMVDKSAETVDLNLEQDGIVKESPVSVTPPTSLTEFNLDNFNILNNVGKEEIEEEEKPVVQEESKEVVAMPPMPDEILAQAPTEVNNNLFATTEDKQTEQTNENTPPTLDKPIIDTPFTNPNFDSSNQEEEKEVIGTDNVVDQDSVVVNADIPTDLGPAGLTDTNVENNAQDQNQENNFIPEEKAEPVQLEEKSIPNGVFDDLKNEINKTIDSFKSRFENFEKNVEEKKDDIIENKELPQDLNEDLSTSFVTNPNVMPDSFNNTADMTVVSDEFAVNDSDLSSVDDTPIQGGKFI